MDKINEQMAEALVLEQLPEPLQVKVKEEGLDEIETYYQDEDGCDIQTIRNS